MTLTQHFHFFMGTKDVVTMLVDPNSGLKPCLVDFPLFKKKYGDLSTEDIFTYLWRLV